MRSLRTLYMRLNSYVTSKKPSSSDFIAGNGLLQTVLGVGSVAPHRCGGLVYLQHKAWSCSRQVTSFKQHLPGIDSACLQHYQTLLHEMYVSYLKRRHASDPRLLTRASRTRYGTRLHARQSSVACLTGPEAAMSLTTTIVKDRTGIIRGSAVIFSNKRRWRVWPPTRHTCNDVAPTCRTSAAHG